MKKILVLTIYDQDATYFYRILPLFYINNAEITISRKRYEGQIGYSFFENYTHVFLERPSGNEDLSLIKLAKQMGLTIISDYDDDIIHLPITNPMWHHYQQCKANVMECLALSDEVWVSTKTLKKAYSLLNNNIHILPNCHNNFLFPIEKKVKFNMKTKKIIWRGGLSHEADVYDYASNIIKLINKNKKWQFQFIGCRFIYLELHCDKNYTPVSPMPLMQYFDYMGTENPNIVLHPLQDNLFNRSKSNIAFIEATYAGAAFFGNTNLPEFSKECIFPLNELSEAMGKNYLGAMEAANNESWDYIQANLLLSDVNKLREERLLVL